MYQKLSDLLGCINHNVSSNRLQIILTVMHNDLIEETDLSEYDLNLIDILNASIEYKDYYFIDTLYKDLLCDSDLNDIFELLIDNDDNGQYFNKLMTLMFSFEDIKINRYKSKEISYTTNELSDELIDVLSERILNKLKHLKLKLWNKLKKKLKI